MSCSAPKRLLSEVRYFIYLAIAIVVVAQFGKACAIGRVFDGFDLATRAVDIRRLGTIAVGCGE